MEEGEKYAHRLHQVHKLSAVAMAPSDDITQFSGLHWRAARNVGHGLDDIARFSGLHWRAGGLHGMWVMVWMILHG